MHGPDCLTRLHPHPVPSFLSYKEGLSKLVMREQDLLEMGSCLLGMTP
jgi:hypothetical protein